jgi:hypothetical protein
MEPLEQDYKAIACQSVAFLLWKLEIRRGNS